MKLDNKGFAISGILYAVMILFLTLILALLSMISNRKLALDKYKSEIKTSLNEGAETDGARVQISSDTLYVRIYEDELAEYDFKYNVAGCLNNGTTPEELNILCQTREIDVTNLVNYRIYDEVGNEVINFNFKTINSGDGFKVDVASYTHYEKDASGNYVLDATKRKLKVVSEDLKVNQENKFIIRYFVVDGNNILSKEATRTLVIFKCNNYINVLDSNFSISKSELKTHDYFSHANSYKINGNTLVKDNTLLNYKIYNDADEDVTSFILKDDLWYYKVGSKEIPVGQEERFRIRYFTGTLAEPTSEVHFAYFMTD